MHIFFHVWFILLVCSFLFVCVDTLTRSPVSWVQKLAWILVTLYTGIIGALLYWFACRKPFHQDHQTYTAPMWKQGVNSEMHCVAGDATGIIIAAIVLKLFSFSNGVDIVFEYVTAFICGLFIFQALMMRSMFNNQYWLAVQKTFFAEAVSMNCVMIGMLPISFYFLQTLVGAGDPLSLSFWFRMDMATIVSIITAYPINYWLVKKGLKHGCMTLPPKNTMPMQTPMSGMDMSAHTEHKMNTLPLWQQLGWITATFFVLLFVLYLLSTRVVPIVF